MIGYFTHRMKYYNIIVLLQLYISFGIFWIVMYASVVFMMCIENPYTMMVRTFIERKV